MSKNKKKDKPKKREPEINIMALSLACRRPVCDFWTNGRKYRHPGTFIHK